MFYVYILHCADKSYYIGHTDDLENRLSEHNNKKFAGYTSSRLPVELVYAEAFETRIEALIIEQKLKKWSRNKKHALINGNWDKLSILTKKDFKKN